MAGDLPPPPPPKKVKMPPMTEADKKNLGIPAGSPAPSAKGHKGGGGGGAVMAGPMIGNPMMGSPMCTPMMGGGGYPGIGGMGPNLVFNFNQPYGYAMAAVVAAEDGGGEEEKEAEKPKPEYVQADPTWRNPRLVQQKGKPLKKEPCVIQ